MTRKPGRHFLQIPGPSAVPDRVLHAIARQTIDHRGPDFAALGHRALAGMKTVFRTTLGEVFIYPSSGTGAWEAALSNTLSPGDRIVVSETGHFATLWHALGQRLGFRAELLPGSWRTGAAPETIAKTLAADRERSIKAVCVVHNETSTGTVSDIAAVRAAIDAQDHPALLFVDTVSGLAAVPFEFDQWGVDVAVAASQKGLMLPPGLAFTAVSPKAFDAHQAARSSRGYWSWSAMKGPNAIGQFPYTPATNLLYGLLEAIDMVHEEGLEAVWARHNRHGAATRAAVRAMGLEVLCAEEASASGVSTAVLMPEGHSADRLRRVALDAFDISLGNGLGNVADKVFRIGHLGDFNDLMLVGALGGVEMAFQRAHVPHRAGGVQAAMSHLAAHDLIAVAAQ